MRESSHRLQLNLELLKLRKPPVSKRSWPGLYDQLPTAPPLDFDELAARKVDEAADQAADADRFAAWAALQPPDVLAYLLFLHWLRLGLLGAFRDHGELWRAWRVEYIQYDPRALLAQLVDWHFRPDPDEEDDDEDTDPPPLPCGLIELETT